MRSKKQRLEDDVVRWARLLVSHQSTSTMDELRAAVGRLDEHLGDITDAVGGFNIGSPTSENAAQLSRVIAYSTRHRIITEIRALNRLTTLVGLTDDELERRLKKPHTTVSSARNWLVNAGWLIDSGFTRTTRGGREAAVWRLTDAAKEAVTNPNWATERSK